MDPVPYAILKHRMTLRQGDLEMKFLGHQVKVLVIGIGQMHKLLSQDLAKQDRAGHGIYGHRYQVSVGSCYGGRRQNYVRKCRLKEPQPIGEGSVTSLMT